MKTTLFTDWKHSSFGLQFIEKTFSDTSFCTKCLRFFGRELHEFDSLSNERVYLEEEQHDSNSSNRFKKMIYIIKCHG